MAGKSSLLSAILGELVHSRGRVSIHGSIGYVSQTPWIMSASIRHGNTPTALLLHALLQSPRLSCSDAACSCIPWASLDLRHCLRVKATLGLNQAPENLPGIGLVPPSGTKRDKKALHVPTEAVAAGARDNILFGMPHHQERYEEVLRACALAQDTAGMTDGDLTLAGDRGSALSGGQCTRIALARALYQVT